MESVHNPDRFMADLRQILSQGRKRIGILIGAGAPMSLRVDDHGHIHAATGQPLIPGVDELTGRVIDSLEGAYAAAANAVRQELGADANIETILSRVRLLQTAIGTQEVNGLTGAGYTDLARQMCAKIGEIVGVELPPERNAYNELVAWVSGTLRAHPVEIFTTNYDLLLEQAFERARAPFFDGFTGGCAPFFDPVTVASDDLPARWSRLWKLHGSLGWAMEEGTIVRGRGHAASQLIYPDYLKYDLTQKQPYAALFERLKRFLLTPDTLLLTTGFSFRDAHVCAILDEALAVNANSAVFAFQFNELNAEVAACKLALDRPNLSIYAADGAVIRAVAGRWRLGDLPKNWSEIRSTFWGESSEAAPPSFLLGDFSRFARFCSLTQADEFGLDRAQGTDDAPLAEPEELDAGQ